MNRIGRWGVGLLGALVLASVCAPSALADWPVYGHDLSNSRDGGTGGPPVSEVSGMSEKWSFESQDGDFTGTPVVAGGALVAVSGGGTVFVLDPKTGALKWSRDLIPDASEDPEEYSVNGSAAISEGRVYVPVAKASDPRLVALSLKDGAQLWNAQLDAQPESDVFGSPVVWGGNVYIGTSALFGELHDPDVHVRGSTVALDAKSGARRWKTYTVPSGRDGGSVWSTPAIDAATGKLFVGTGNAYHEPAAATTDSVLELDARSGRLLDHYQATPDDVWNGTTGIASGPDSDFGASPNLMTGPDGRKLVGDGQKSGTYWALDRKRLDEVWHTNIGPSTALGGILGSTAYDGHAVYGPNTPAGEIWSLGVDGRMRWASADGDPLHFASVSTANGVVYSPDMNGFLNARDADSGAPLAKLPLGGSSWGGVAVSGGMVYAATGTQDTVTGALESDTGLVKGFGTG